MSNRFVQIYRDYDLREKFYPFLKNVLRIYPAGDLEALIRRTVNAHEKEEEIYKAIQGGLPHIQSGLATMRRSVSALKHQRRVMLDQTVELLKTPTGKVRKIGTYVEIGTKGRYVRPLREELGFTQCYLVTDKEPGFLPADVLERAGLSRPWQFLPLSYGPIFSIPKESADLVSIYIGIHHGSPALIPDFLSSIKRILRPDGHLIIREHDCTSPEMHLIAGLAHDVFDVATGVSWEEHSKDTTSFHSIDEYEEMFSQRGFVKMGNGLLQDGDPSLNTLVRFQKK